MVEIGQVDSLPESTGRLSFEVPLKAIPRDEIQFARVGVATSRCGRRARCASTAELLPQGISECRAARVDQDELSTINHEGHRAGVDFSADTCLPEKPA